MIPTARTSEPPRSRLRRAAPWAAAAVALWTMTVSPGAVEAQESDPPAPDRPETVTAGPEAAPPAPGPGALPAPPSRPQEAGFLGVAIENVTDEEAAELGLSEPRGVRITDVLDESPAAEAGLQEGDVLLEWDGEAVSSTLQLRRMVRETPPGRDVEIGYLRGGQRSGATVTVDEPWGPGARFHAMDEEERRALHQDVERIREKALERSREAREEARKARVELRRELGGERPAMVRLARLHGPRIGVRLNSLTDQLADYFGLEDRTGALVVSVEDDSPAREAGIRAGDVILAADGSTVASPADVARAVRGAGGESLEIELLRRGERRSVTVVVPEQEDPSARHESIDAVEVELRALGPDLRRSLEGLEPRIRMLRPLLRGHGPGEIII